MFKAGFIDSWGRGYKKIQDAFKKEELPVPIVRNHFSGVQVVIKRTIFQRLNQNVGENVKNVGENVKNVGENVKNVGEKRPTKITRRYNNIKQFINDNPYISAKTISELLSVSVRTIERDLAKLQRDGILVREGDDKSGRWVIIEQLQQNAD